MFALGISSKICCVCSALSGCVEIQNDDWFNAVNVREKMKFPVLILDLLCVYGLVKLYLF